MPWNESQTYHEKSTQEGVLLNIHLCWWEGGSRGRGTQFDSWVRKFRSPGEGIGYPLYYSWASLVAQMVKNLPAMRETWVRSLGWEDPLEEGMATQSSIRAWRIPMDRGAWGATVHGVAKSRTQLKHSTHTYSWLILLYSRNQHNIVKQLNSNNNIF